MRLAIVSPHFPPDRCGVGDYTARLARELATAGHEVMVSTARVDAHGGPGVDLQPRSYPWTPARLGSIAEDIRKFRPDFISVQYTPYLYAPRLYGIQPLLPAWLRWLKERAKSPVALTAHERHYPTGWSSDRLLIGGPQWAIFQALALAADHVFFTNECFRNEFRDKFAFRGDRYSWLPVGANIEPEETGGRRDESTLLFFGGAHPTKLFERCFEALAAARAKFRDARLLLVGTWAQEIPGTLPEGAEALGYVDAAEVSRQLNQATLLVAPFLDGVSTRRGSVMAALAHGCPVLTNRGHFSDPSVDWASFCIVAEEANFGRAAALALEDRAGREALSRAGLRAYAERFAWPRIAAEMLSRLESSRKPR